MLGLLVDSLYIGDYSKLGNKLRTIQTQQYNSNKKTEYVELILEGICLLIFLKLSILTKLYLHAQSTSMCFKFPIRIYANNRSKQTYEHLPLL
ncbi:hypothetical protein AtEden1_Chr4g0296911 [Arabidopsis thaliana]